MRWPRFAGPSTPSQSPTFQQERTVNFYTEAGETGAASERCLLPTPGVEVFATATTAAASPGRAIFHQNGRCFSVIGYTFYEVFANGTMTSRGTVAVVNLTDPATISSNGDGGGELFITSGDKGYLYTLATNAFVEVLSSGATMGAMIDGYFLALDTANSLWAISGLYDGATWDPLQFQQRSAAPDRWVSLVVVNRDVWLLGEETSEVWANVGTVPFPFALQSGGVVPWGIAAPFSAKVAADALIWLAKTARGQGAIVQATGVSVRVISPQALENTIRGYGTVSDAVAETYDDAGHVFYLLTFPSADATWQYDLTMPNEWCERLTWNITTAVYEAWRPLYHAFAFGLHLVCDRADGIIYRMSIDLPNDVGGGVIRRLRQPPLLVNEHRRVFISRLELYGDVGVGTVSGQGSDPLVMLQYTRDGQIWKAAPDRRAGKIGEYGTRIIWNQMGSGYRTGIRFVVTDPVPYKWSSCFAEVH